KSPLYFSASRIASPSSGLQGVRLARVRLDLAIFAIRLAQKVAGVGLAVEAGDRAVDEHYGYICKPNSQSLQEKCATVSGYTSNAQIAPNLLISIHKLSMSERRKGRTSITTELSPPRRYMWAACVRPLSEPASQVLTLDALGSVSMQNYPFRPRRLTKAAIAVPISSGLSS